MQITLAKPELKEFIDQQVSAGHFKSPEAVVEAALARLMMEEMPQHLKQEVWDAIKEGNAQIERGEGVRFREFAAKLRQKNCGG